MATMKCDMARRRRRGRRRPSPSPSSGCRSRSRRTRRWPRTWSPARAMRPGDVLTMYGGKTVEVINTDAEGRLVLADAPRDGRRARARRDHRRRHPDRAMVVALGDQVAGVFGDDDDRRPPCRGRGRPTGEMLWPLPIPEEIRERSAPSKVADLLQHDWVRWGGGAARRGVPARVHRRPPVGPPRHRRPGVQHRRRRGVTSPSGGTGFGIATLVDYVAARLVDLAARAGRTLRRGRRRRFFWLLPGGCSRASAAGCRPPRRRTTGRWCGWQNSWAQPHRRHPAPGPLAVVRDQQQGHVADRGARLDEALDAPAGGDELAQVLPRRRASEARTRVEPVRCGVAAGDGTCGPRA